MCRHALQSNPEPRPSLPLTLLLQVKSGRNDDNNQLQFHHPDKKVLVREALLLNKIMSASKKGSIQATGINNLTPLARDDYKYTALQAKLNHILTMFFALTSAPASIKRKVISL